METKMVEVTKAVYNQKMLDKVFPAIKSTWPGGPLEANVQQDNAPSDRINNDPDIVAVGTADSWNTTLINQQPNSPDTNILDLFFFYLYPVPSGPIDVTHGVELNAEIMQLFAVQDSGTLGRVWTAYQAVLQDIMLAKGDNIFKLPHLHKETCIQQ